MASIIDNATGATFNSLYYGFVYMVYVIAMISCVFAVCTKRRHDRDKSGWWSLIMFVPFIGANRLIVDLGILEGTRGANRFGSDPLA